MERGPLTLQQAQQLREHFIHLVGKPLNSDPGDGLIVNCVAVVPYDEVNKYIFILDYRECDNLESAIAFYESWLFDVEVISRVVSDKVQIFHKDLRTYLKERNIPLPDISSPPAESLETT
jgi:hypothetical protein